MKIALLAQGIIAKNCIEVFEDESFKNIKIPLIVTSNSFYQNETNRILKGVEYIDNSNRNEELILQAFHKYDIKAIISIQHPWILSNEIIDYVDGKSYNLHNAKLPNYKGHNSISHAILNSDNHYTTTIHKLIPRVDMGDIIFEETIPIFKDDTAYSLYNKTLSPAKKNFKKLISHLNLGIELPIKKIESEGKFYSRFNLEELKEIKLDDDWEVINRKVRAFYFPPHEPAFIKIGKNKIYPHIDISKYYN